MNDENLSAEWVFQADARLKDYHKNMDGVMFQRWVNKQLIPAFQARFPGMKMNLILDNAPYHHTFPKDNINCKSNKDTCIKFLDQLIDAEEDEAIVEEMKVLVSVEGYTFDRTRWGKKGSRKLDASGLPTEGPYTEDVQYHLKQMLKKHYPNKLKTELQVLFDDLGWTLIFTPPYMPKFQPIERFWAYTKNGVAQEWRSDRKIKATYTDVMIMWYGGTGVKTLKVRQPVMASICEGFIRHSYKDMDKWITKFGVKTKGGTMVDFKWDKTALYSDGLSHDDVIEYGADDVEDDGDGYGVA